MPLNIKLYLSRRSCIIYDFFLDVRSQQAARAMYVVHWAP